MIIKTIETTSRTASDRGNRNLLISWEEEIKKNDFIKIKRQIKKIIRKCNKKFTKQ